MESRGEKENYTLRELSLIYNCEEETIRNVIDEYMKEKRLRELHNEIGDYVIK